MKILEVNKKKSVQNLKLVKLILTFVGLYKWKANQSKM